MIDRSFVRSLSAGWRRSGVADDRHDVALWAPDERPGGEEAASDRLPGVVHGTGEGRPHARHPLGHRRHTGQPVHRPRLVGASQRRATTSTYDVIINISLIYLLTYLLTCWDEPRDSARLRRGVRPSCGWAGHVRWPRDAHRRVTRPTALTLERQDGIDRQTDRRTPDRCQTRPAERYSKSITSICCGFVKLCAKSATDRSSGV